MKSQRRHELKTNALARGLEALPSHWKDYGSRVLLAVLVALIVFLGFRYWNDKKALEAQQLNSSIETVQTELSRLDSLVSGDAASASAIAKERKLAATEADNAISTILTTSSDPKIKASALLARGDLNWKLAEAPDPPGSDTRPDLKVPNRQGLLENASHAYQEALQPPYSSDPLVVFRARVGLAAIAENNGQWADARREYEALAGAANIPASFKDYAQQRIADLAKLQKPVLLGEFKPPPPPTTSPATAPSTTAPSIFGPMPLPSSAPASRPG